MNSELRFCYFVMEVLQKKSKIYLIYTLALLKVNYSRAHRGDDNAAGGVGDDVA